jgi:hypothetical protein
VQDSRRMGWDGMGWGEMERQVLDRVFDPTELDRCTYRVQRESGWEIIIVAIFLRGFVTDYIHDSVCVRRIGR